MTSIRQFLSEPQNFKHLMGRPGFEYMGVLKAPVTYQGLRIKGRFLLDKNYRLLSFYLDGDQFINGAFYKALPENNLYSQIQTYPTGIVFLGTLKGDQNIQGIKMKDDTYLGFHENGNLRFYYQDGVVKRFNEDGSVHEEEDNSLKCAYIDRNGELHVTE